MGQDGLVADEARRDEKALQNRMLVTSATKNKP